MLTNLIHVVRDEEGATLVEYGLLVSLIAVVCIAMVTLLGKSVLGVFTSINKQI